MPPARRSGSPRRRGASTRDLPGSSDWPAQPALPPSWTAAVQISSLAPLRRSVQEGKKVPAIPERLL
ncbi:MAG: hypothetical protein ACJ76Y_00805 [Thermoanaerobaculia bacterium]